MASVNRVILLGNLGHSPKLSYTPDGIAVCRISMATSRKYRRNDNSIADETEWHTAVAYGRLAEVISEYVQKGNRLYVEGRLRTRKYTGRDGIEKTVTEVIVESAQFFQTQAKESTR